MQIFLIFSHCLAQSAIHPLDVMMDAWNKTVSVDKVVGSSTFAIAMIDKSTNQLTYSNIGDGGLILLRQIESEKAGYMR